MNFDLQKSIDILSRTPQVLHTLLAGTSVSWSEENEGPGSWSPKEIISHLILGEKTDWIPRLKLILAEDASKSFDAFDMTAHLSYAAERTTEALLQEFETLRIQNLDFLNQLNLSSDDLKKVGVHPALGDCSAKDLLATWTVHDLGHISQIARVMAKQYKTEVGPWIAFAGILKK